MSTDAGMQRKRVSGRAAQHSEYTLTDHPKESGEKDNKGVSIRGITVHGSGCVHRGHRWLSFVCTPDTPSALVQCWASQRKTNEQHCKQDTFNSEETRG